MSWPKSTVCLIYYPVSIPQTLRQLQRPAHGYGAYLNCQFPYSARTETNAGNRPRLYTIEPSVDDIYLRDGIESEVSRISITPVCTNLLPQGCHLNVAIKPVERIQHMNIPLFRRRASKQNNHCQWTSPGYLFEVCDYTSLATPWLPAALWSLIRPFDYLAIAFSLSSLAFLTAGLASILWYQAQLVGYLDSHS